MRIVIFGASGATGQVLVEQALASGHHVTAFVRDPGRLTLRHERLRLVQGDVRDSAAVEQAIASQAAVLSALGQTRPPTPGLLRSAVANLVAAMKRHGVRRLIYLTGAGVRDPQDPPSPVRSLIVGLMKLTAREVLDDSEAAYAAVRASDVDWTIVRAPILSSAPARGALRAVFTPPGPVQISRADVAAFMLQQLVDVTYVRRSPMVVY